MFPDRPYRVVTDWSFGHSLPDNMTETVEPKPNLSRRGSNVLYYSVPGQYMYEDVLLGAGIPPNRFTEIRDMDIRDDDIIIASYPKTGTTLLQEIVWLINNHADVEQANNSYNYERILFIEFISQNQLDKVPSPRHFKTHVPYRFLPQKSAHKTVYIMRNPKDVLVSYYHFYRMCIPLGNYKGTWNDFFQMFVNNDGKLYYGNMFDHMLAFWEHRDDPNLHIVFFEDIIRKPHEKVREIAKFLGKDLSPREIDRIVQATSFKKMKSNPKTNWSSLTHEVDLSISPFMRRGIIGDWKEHFTRGQNEIFDRMAEGKLFDTGLRFIYH